MVNSKNTYAMKLVKTLVTLTVLGCMATSCGQDKKETPASMVKAVAEPVETAAEKMEMETPPTIVGVAASNENFSTLVAAVKAADLVETLNSEGPFTVFAPTNEGFAKLPAGTVEGLLQPGNKEALTGILTYHVVSGSYNAEAVINAINENNGSFSVPTVQGGSIALSLSDGQVILTDAKGGTATVVMADVETSNGLIHAIDAVVLPQ